MRRVLVLLTSAAVLSGIILTGGGCGSQSYEARLTKTFEDRKYQKRLDDNLMEPPKKDQGKYEELGIYIRPPKSLAWSKEFLLAVVPPGQFDLEGSFLEAKTGTNLHVLARVKKAVNTKKKAAAPVNQGEFATDVIGIVNSVYGSALDPSKFKEKEVNKSKNIFRHHALEANEKNIQIYLYGKKTDTYQVALIFEYPKAEHAALISKIELCLESFAVGNRARRAYAGTAGDEEEGPAGPAAPF